MSWWRKKADDKAGDDILDLDNVVWRGGTKNNRLKGKAKTTKQTDKDVPLPQENISASEQIIETEIRNQIITEAMDAVMNFQKGQGQPPQDGDFDRAELEAALGEIADQNAPKSPDMSEAIRDVVADEIGLWLKDHMPRIIAEAMAQASLTKGKTKPAKAKTKAKSKTKAKAKTASKSKAKKGKPKTKTASKSTAKTATKKAVKKSNQSKAKPKVKAKAAKKSAKTPKSKAKKGKS